MFLPSINLVSLCPSCANGILSISCEYYSDHCCKYYQLSKVQQLEMVIFGWRSVNLQIMHLINDLAHHVQYILLFLGQ